MWGGEACRQKEAPPASLLPGARPVGCSQGQGMPLESAARERNLMSLVSGRDNGCAGTASHPAGRRAWQHPDRLSQQPRSTT